MDRDPEGLSESTAAERAKEIEELIRLREEDQTPAWLLIVDDLAQGDRTRWDFFFNMGVVEGLNAYSFAMAKRRALAEDLNESAKNGPHAYISHALTKILFTR